MSSTGATLSGSYSGATGSVTETGFYYGTTSSPNTKVTASGTSSPFSKALTGLTANTTYHYKAYIVEGGQEVAGSVLSFKTKAVATATVSNSAATSVTSSSAVLNGSYDDASGTIYETGFYWGTAQNSLTEKATTDGSNASSGSFSCTIGGQSPLSASTPYYYKAYVLEYNESTGEYEERIASSAQSFTTAAVAQQQTWQEYLSGYGMPDVSGLGTSLRQSGTYSDRDDKWYSVNTSNNKRQIAIHTYTTGSPSSSETLNYVVLYDETKYAPVWTYHVMNTYYWPDNNAGRNDSWMDDPAISLTQQGGLDNASTVGYSRGHLVASDYRQTNVKQNKQTFYHSNQAPQWQNSFNGGMWSTLEGRVKTMTPSSTSEMLYVITGVLYEGTVSNNQVTSSTIPTLPSGNKNVPIPSHFYKCIMKCTFSGSTITGAQGIAFVYTNEAHSGNYYASTFVTSINAIEQRTGFNFFANVPGDYSGGLQDTAESNSNHYWFTGQGSPNSISGVNDKSWGSF